jgi:hypothetical protein
MSNNCDKGNMVIEKHFKELRNRPGVLNVVPGPKIVDGVQTDTCAIIVIVQEKKPLSLLSAVEVVPKSIEGIPTDVIELKPEGWQAGDTEPSHRSPEAQRRMSSGVIR